MFCDNNSLEHVRLKRHYIHVVPIAGQIFASMLWNKAFDTCTFSCSLFPAINNKGLAMICVHCLPIE